ncbi:MAG TPA: hypothetical protein V6D19_06585 [Stenomitos sp.]
MKVKEAALNLQDARLGLQQAQETLLGAQSAEKLAKNALPSAAQAVTDALLNFATNLKTGRIQRQILNVQNQTKAEAFNAEERNRSRSVAIEAVDRGLSVPGTARGGDRFGFAAARAKFQQQFTEGRLQLQRSLAGTSALALPAAVTPTLDDSNAQLEQAMQGMSIGAGFGKMVNILERLLDTEQRLSAQILSLANRPNVQTRHTTIMAPSSSILDGTGY